MKKNYFRNYIKTTHFQERSSEANIKKDYQLMDKYFQKNYLRFLPKNKNGKILDLGCGMGHFLYFLKYNGYKNYYGIDIGKECIDFCLKQKLGSKKNIIYQGIEEFLKKNKIGYFDIIVMNDILEHLEKDKIISILVKIKSKLSQNGKLIIKVVNSANPITGSSSRYYDFTHSVGFVEESLTQVLKLAKYNKIKVYPQNIFVFNSLINLVGKSIQSLFNLIFRLLFLLYGRKTTKIFTKDIIAVAEK
jgi:2-polyprenyl-3-methyl-5-hydroxy-6-metoxy-1,4-benzoquinol methylase